MGLFLTANWAFAMRLAPRQETGKFLGLVNLATAGAAAAGRLQGPMIDMLNSYKSGAWYGYSAVFLLGALSISISAGLLHRLSKENSPRIGLSFLDISCCRLRLTCIREGFKMASDFL